MIPRSFFSLDYICDLFFFKQDGILSKGYLCVKASGIEENRRIAFGGVVFFLLPDCPTASERFGGTLFRAFSCGLLVFLYHFSNHVPVSCVYVTPLPVGLSFRCHGIRRSRIEKH